MKSSWKLIPPSMTTHVKQCLVFGLAMLVTSLSGCGKSASRPPIQATLETSAGNIVLRLDSAKAPLSVDNFVSYARSGYYDGTIFHRVIDGFMIQGGGHLPDLSRRPEPFPPVKNEAQNGLRNRAMSIAFARGDDPDSALAQFYINQVDNDYLNYSPGQSAGYTVFGEVVEGEEVVHRIAAMKTQALGEFENLPMETVVIMKVAIEQPSDN